MQRTLKLKILAIQFKSLGDAVLMIPALAAIRNHFPGCQLHVLAPDRAKPLLENLPWISRIWTMTRVRGRARLRENWPIIRALRAERFDCSVDFAGNDRGAILSLLTGARERLGLDATGSFGKRICFTRRIVPAPNDQHEAWRNFRVLSAWNITPPESLAVSINPDPALAGIAEKYLPEPTILCHMGAGMPRKQWPVRHWATYCRQASAAGFRLAFTAGENVREQALATELKTLVPDARILPPLGMAEFLAVLARAQALVTGDTGPMHFAAALGVPLVALFGASSAVRWRPLAQNSRLLAGASCTCDVAWHDCRSPNHCLAQISPEQVLSAVKSLLPAGRLPE